MEIILYYIFKIRKILKGVAIHRSAQGVDSKIEPGTEFIGSSIGRHSYVGYDSFVLNSDIGSFCSIANNVTIGGANHPMHFVSTSPVFLSHRDSVKAKFAGFHYNPVVKTKVENDVWIGANAIIISGVTVGNGAVIGAGAVVTKNVAPYSVVAGNPAKHIKYRFTEDLIVKLIASAWWDMNDNDLKRFGSVFNDPRAFLNRLNQTE